tara:strand:+ start:266 stop:487 length:222 start_codon:yes stop_codon:yes gene_type:complete
MKKNEELIEDALSKITLEMLNNLEYGEGIELNEEYILYHYFDSEVVEVNHTATWDNMFAVLWSNEEIIFEQLY